MRAAFVITGSILTCFVILGATSASADWNDDDPGVWGAHLCQTRSLMAAGLQLGAVAGGLAAAEETELAIIHGATGTALFAASLGMRGALRGEPDAARNTWPSRRCRARSLISHGVVHLIGFAAVLWQLFKEPASGLARFVRLFTVMMIAVPYGIGAVTLLIGGIRRLRRWRDDNAASAAPLLSVPVGSGASIGIGTRGLSFSAVF